MNKIIFNYLVKNVFTTILVMDLFAIVSLLIYNNYWKELEENNHEIGVSPYIIYSISALVLFFYFFVGTLPIYLNLIKEVRRRYLFCVLSFFLVPIIQVFIVLYLKSFNSIMILISLGCMVIYINFYYRYTKFLMSLKTLLD